MCRASSAIGKLRQSRRPDFGEETMSEVRPVDNSANIPSAVKAAAERARQAHAAAYPKPEDTPAEEATAEEVTQQVTEENPEEPAQGELQFGSDEVKTQEVTEASAPEPVVDDASWEHRYKSMKGRYDRANTQISDLSDQISNLQNVISTMQVRQRPEEDDDPQLSFERLLTPEEEEDYGQEFLSVVGKKAKEELLPIVSKYERKIAELESRLQGVNGYVTQDARSRMETMLDTKVPDWRELNTDNDFLTWLKLPDPFSGVIRHELLKTAYEQNDSPRVVAFFQGFLSEEAAVAPALGSSVPTNTAPKMDLSEFAAPGRAKTAAANAPVEKPVFTRTQIAQFYKDAAAGKYRGKESEKNRIEQQIFEAQSDGRIR
jgi:hypothetical protein